jgi:hypothetical protein
MKFLILHDVDLAKGLRRSTFNQTFCLPKYAQHHEFILHYLHHPVTDEIRAPDIDVIILDMTFLCYRWLRPRSEFDQIKKNTRSSPLLRP